MKEHLVFSEGISSTKEASNGVKAGLLEAVVKEMQIGVLVMDAGKKLLYANPFFEKTFSVEGKPEGKNLSGVIKDKAVIEVIEKMLSSKGKQPQEITIQGKGSQILEARLVPFLISESIPPHPMGTDLKSVPNKGGRGDLQKVLIGFFHDVTEEKRVEAIKRDFVANVSHELRTPLSSIKGYAETLLDGAMSDKATLKNFLTIIDRHANRMTALIEDLLTLSMLESHQMPMSFESLDIKGLINSIIQGFEKQAKDKDIEIVMDIGKEIPKIPADKDRLEQVIVNLVDNAIKYTNKGTVTVSSREVDNMIQIDVEDTGIGIPEKDIPRIFERFYRVDKGRSRELGGTGLGLAIVKHIIQGHNGKIWVKSELGKGSSFSFSLPLGKASNRTNKLSN